jgi:cytochrome c556
MRKAIFAAALVWLAAQGTALAQVKPETLVKQRQSAMTLQGKYMGQLGRMAQGREPYNAAVAARNASFLDALSKMPWDGFDPSTKDVKSRALPAVFAEPAKFKQAADRYQGEVAKLVAATKGADEGAVKSAIGAVGKACAGCHDDFQQPQ